MSWNEPDFYLDENGYLRYINTKRLVHRSIAYEHIYLLNRSKYPLPFGTYQVHHKDENKLNNDPQNLEILTSEEHEALHGIQPEFSFNTLIKIILFLLILYFLLHFAGFT